MRDFFGAWADNGGKMRKFSARWWVPDPLQRYREATEDRPEGIPVRVVREASAEDVRDYVRLRWVLEAPTL